MKSIKQPIGYVIYLCLLFFFTYQLFRWEKVLYMQDAQNFEYSKSTVFLFLIGIGVGACLSLFYLYRTSKQNGRWEYNWGIFLTVCLPIILFSCALISFVFYPDLIELSFFNMLIMLGDGFNYFMLITGILAGYFVLACFEKKSFPN